MTDGGTLAPRLNRGNDDVVRRPTNNSRRSSFNGVVNTQLSRKDADCDSHFQLWYHEQARPRYARSMTVNLKRRGTRHTTMPKGREVGVGESIEPDRNNGPEARSAARYCPGGFSTITGWRWQAWRRGNNCRKRRHLLVSRQSYYVDVHLLTLVYINFQSMPAATGSTFGILRKTCPFPPFPP